MVSIQGLFETHLTVSQLDRAVHFYRDVLKLPLALLFAERRVAFFWIGAPGQAMLGIWETGTGPQKMSLHTAFQVSLEDVLAAPAMLQAAGITALNLATEPATEPDVLAWMPAASIYFRDPDGNLLEFLSMLQQPPRPDLGVLPWSAFVRTTGIAS